MNPPSRRSRVWKTIRSRGREIALVVALVLINYLIFSRLAMLVVGTQEATPTPTRTPKPTFTPSYVVVPTPTPAREPSPTLEPTPLASPTPSLHVVQAGETLSEIARMYGTNVDAIVEANDLSSADAIREGQLIVVPAPTPTPVEEATVAPASSPSTIVGRRIHVVQEGETLSEIARTYGVTTAELVQTNGLDDPNAISVGQALVIP